MRTVDALVRTTIMASLVLAAVPALAGDAGAAAYQKSYKLEAAGKYKDALRSLKKAGAVRKHTYTYQLRLAWLNYLSGKLSASRQAYAAAARLAPTALEPLQGMLLPQIAQRRWVDAVRTARKLLRVAPGDFTGHSKLAWALYNLGRFADAERAYRKVLELYPSNLTMRAGLGWSLLKQNKLADARRAFAAVLAVSPRDRTAEAGLKAVGK